MKRLLLLNGPNLNRLGQREPDTYGTETLADVINKVKAVTDEYQYELEHFQSNHEGELIDKLHETEGEVSGIVFNPAAYTHTSVALRDAIASITAPVIEVHISNVHQREEFRHHSMLAPVCEGQIVGFGTDGYRLAALGLLKKL
ncbi:3-dehydroquinate dehydratase [Halobacillus andaensis]|uniref:3-dehydroquinate dehydratase n=1 Tax=Halobacillus andaensis TaxID=1176239 RepID=A0A917B048_HALAA|nr:type II 3-dehydroquinate dehydratase [Halobacillus andaensis]MBP2003124.1 3-dehydroquinate dehydratase-2 [Halobacillus andaensis]GGF08237.1 3-dehydroquinate dehydratase [Halobacillus andaensis]